MSITFGDLLGKQSFFFFLEGGFIAKEVRNMLSYRVLIILLLGIR